MNRRGFFKKFAKGLLGACAAAVGMKLLPDAEPASYKLKRTTHSARHWKQITINTAASKERWVDETLRPGWTKEDEDKYRAVWH